MLQAQVTGMEWGSHHMTLWSPDGKIHGAIMGPIWGRQAPGGPFVGPMNFAIWVSAPAHYPFTKILNFRLYKVKHLANIFVNIISLIQPI